MRLDNIIRIAAFIITCLIVAATWNVKRKNGTGAHIKQEQETTKTAPDQHRLNPAHNTAHSGFSLMPQKSEQVRLSPIAQPQPKVLTSSTTAQDATARDSSQKSPRVSLPPFSSDVGRIMHLLHVTPEMIARDSARFRQDTRYVEWMERIDSVLGDSLGKEMKDVLGADQQEVLYFHELLSNAYLEGTISHDDLMRYLGDVLKNSQTLYMLYLTDSQYRQLFEDSKGETNAAIENTMENIPEFEIMNPETSPDDIREQIASERLGHLRELYRIRAKESIDIAKRLDSGTIDQDTAMKEIDRSYATYRDSAKHILSDEEFRLVFGNDELPIAE